MRWRFFIRHYERQRGDARRGHLFDVPAGLCCGKQLSTCFATKQMMKYKRPVVIGILDGDAPILGSKPHYKNGHSDAEKGRHGDAGMPACLFDRAYCVPYMQIAHK